ncbi:unnamed protein product [Polarella glacialis]|uniref:Uncharacterized protein n=1 Tax=Polarella glacialis TaxID=89957 RepID=A0A813K5H0_POLGL|nr:unnamed protein product [Polarella glacialis]
MIWQNAKVITVVPLLTRPVFTLRVLEDIHPVSLDPQFLEGRLLGPQPGDFPFNFLDPCISQSAIKHGDYVRGSFLYVSASAVLDDWVLVLTPRLPDDTNNRDAAT